MLTPASRLKTKPDEVVTDPVLSGISLVTKKIGDRTYVAYIDSKMAGEDHVKCFPDSPPEMDAHPIPLPPDYQPRTTRSIQLGDFTWKIPTEEFGQTRVAAQASAQHLQTANTRKRTGI